MRRTAAFAALTLAVVVSGAWAAPWERTNGPFSTTIEGLSAHPAKRGEFLLKLANRIYLTTDRGGSYRRTSQVPWTSILYRHPADANRVLLSTAYSTDGGRSWVPMANASMCEVYAAAPSNPDILYGLWGSSGDHAGVQIKRSSDRGKVFLGRGTFAVAGGYKEPLSLSVDAANGDLVYCVVAVADVGPKSGPLYKSTDGGATCVALPGPEPVCFAAACDPFLGSLVYAVCPSGIFRSRDAGASWEGVLDMAFQWQARIDVDPWHEGVVMVRSGDQLLRSGDGGATWARVLAPFASNDFLSLTQDGQVFYGGTSSTIGLTEDGGENWAEVAPPLVPANLGSGGGALAVDYADSRRVYTGLCCQGPAFGTEDGGATWNRIELATLGMAVHPTDPSHVYLLSYDGLQESLDYGVTWQQAGDFKGQTGYAGMYWATTMRFAPGNPSRLYMGTDGQNYPDSTDSRTWGHVFRTDDGGVNWMLLPFEQVNGGILGIAVKSGDPDTLLVATNKIDLYQSVDGGVRWNKTHSVDVKNGIGQHGLFHRMAVDVQNPNVIALSAVNAVYLSEDFGRTWVKRTPTGYQGVSVAIVHPAATLTRLIVPSGIADGYLKLSDDLGKTWRNYSTGIADKITIVGPSTDGTYYATTDTSGVIKGRIDVPGGSGTPSQQAPAIGVSPASLDIGSTLAGTTLQKTVSVANPGTATLSVTSVAVTGTDASQFRASPASFTVAPGGTQAITVTFAPTSGGTKTARLSLVHNATGSPSTMVLTGLSTTVPMPDIEVTPTSLDFGEVRLSERAERRLTIKNTGTLLLTVDSLLTAARVYAATPASTTVAAGQTGEVTVVFAPTAVGDAAAQLAVVSDDPDEGRILVGLSGKGRLPHLTASADTLRFGRATAGQTAAQVLTVTNNSTSLINVTNVVPGDPQYSVSSKVFSLNPGNSRDITVTFTPMEGRSPISTLTVLSNDVEVTSLTVVLTAEGNVGGPPAIAVLPSSLNFGPVALGQSKALTLTISNTGATPLQVVNVIASSPDVTMSKSEFTIAAGGSERLAVTLQPTQVGSFSETLDLPSNDPTHPLLQVPLRATVASGGGKPSLSLDVTTLSFGQVDVGETGEFTLPVRNAGSGSLVISNVVSDNTQVAVSPTSLTIAPQETRSLTVRFRPVPGRERSGKVAIFSNDAVQPQVGVSWSAQDVKVPYLQVLTIKPADGAFNVGPSAEIQLTFSEPLYARRGFTALDLQVSPQPLSGPVEEDVQVRGDGRTVVIPVTMARNTVYRLVIYGATGRSGLELYDMVETSFSTGIAAPVLATLSGGVVVEGAASVSGSVYVFNPSYELVAQSPLSPSNGFEVKGLSEGSYTLYVDGTLSDGRQVTGSYDASGDGVADVVVVKAGVSQAELQIVPVVVSNVPPPVSSTPVEADLDSTTGNQKLTAVKVAAGQGVVLEVYANNVEQLTGAGVTVQYDTSKVWLVGAEEGQAWLKQNGGTALFLSSVDPLNATVEFGGAIMGPTSSTAVSGSGLLGRFRFRVVEGFTGSTELKVTHLTLKTLSGTSQTDLSLTATLSSSTSGGGSGGGTQPAGPGIRVSVGNVTGSAGGTVVVPVSVDNAAGIAGGDLSLGYDANLLVAKQVQGADLLTKAGITVIPNLATPGKVQVSMAGVSGILSGTGVLLNVTFEIKAGAAKGSSLLTLEALLADENGATIPSTAAGGTVTIGGGMVGDVNNDQRVNSADAILVLRYSAGLTMLTEVQKQAGDVNGDGKTNSGDAILILRKSAGLLAQFAKAGKAVAGTTDLVRLLPVERSGAEMVVPVELGAGAAGADLVLRYGAGPIQVTRLDGPEGALLACQAEGSRMLRLSVAREEALAPVTVRLHLLGVNATSAAELVGQVYDEEGQVLGEVPTPLSRPACPKLAGYPNPFNASTTLQYELAEAGQVELVVYGLTGSAVRRLVSAWQGAGIHSAVWDGRNDDGLSVASGLYLARLQTGGARQIQKLMLLE